MLDHSYLLDGRRNRVAQFDTPGVMGPGGFPTFEGAEAWADYLLKHDIQYVIYQIGGSSIEYQYDIWKSRRAFVVPTSRRGGYIKLLAKFELTSLDTLERLGKTRENIFVDGDIHVINLAARRSPLSNLLSNQGSRIRNRASWAVVGIHRVRAEHRLFNFERAMRCLVPRPTWAYFTFARSAPRETPRNQSGRPSPRLRRTRISNQSVRSAVIERTV